MANKLYLNKTENKMQEIKLALQLDEVNAILQVLGDLPTKSGAYPLVLKIKEQAEQQVKVDENVEQD
jgi:isocitrate dehydrogenase kinase/phosphatase